MFEITLREQWHTVEPPFKTAQIMWQPGSKSSGLNSEVLLYMTYICNESFRQEMFLPSRIGIFSSKINLASTMYVKQAYVSLRNIVFEILIFSVKACATKISLWNVTFPLDMGMNTETRNIILILANAFTIYIYFISLLYACKIHSIYTDIEL